MSDAAESFSYIAVEVQWVNAGSYRQEWPGTRPSGGGLPDGSFRCLGAMTRP